MNASKIVRKYFAAYDGRYRETAELLLAEDFTFSSPQDDHIDRAAYFQRCWPNDPSKYDRKLWKVFEDGNEVFVTYECTRADGSIFRNTEFFHVEDGRIRHVDVYFGRDTAEKHKTAGSLPLLSVS